MTQGSDLTDAGTKPFPTKALIWAVVGAGTFGLVLFSVLSFIVFQVVVREEIHDAVRAGDVGRVERILDRNPSRLEQRNRLELTPLHEAAWEGQTEALEVLIRRGADVNAKWDLASTGDGRWNALHITAIHGRVEAAKVLIRGGTDINWKTLKGETPLDLAIQNEKWELADVIRANGGVSGTAR